MTIDLTALDSITFTAGSHSPGDGYCAMEAAAYIAGEPHSDHPQCVCPTIAAFLRAWNDAPWPSNEARTARLRPLVAAAIGTRTTLDDQDTRAFMAADWAVRVFTPAWLRLAKLDEHAVALENLTPIATVALAEASMETMRAARAAAWAAAGPAWAATGAAAWAAARAAAWAAAGDALAPTVEQLQDSAADLVLRMCAIGQEVAA